MKTTIKLSGIIALVALIGLSFVSCGDKSTGDVTIGGTLPTLKGKTQSPAPALPPLR